MAQNRIQQGVIAAAAATLIKKPAPKTAAFTFICENEAFKDEGFVPAITPDQYNRVKAILNEGDASKILVGV